MKKTKWLAGLVAVVVAAALCSCHINVKNDSDDDSSSNNQTQTGDGSSVNGSNETPTPTPTPAAYKAGDTALAKIKIGNVEYEYTEEVYVTGPDGATIQGKNNTNNYPGVFIEKRKVTLSPFIMSKYEVTQEFYTAVMAGQQVTVSEEQKDLSAEPFYCNVNSDYYKDLLSGEEQKYRAADGMTWFDAVYFCNVLSEKTGLTKAYNITVTEVDSKNHITKATVESVANANGYRLPTEAEWEFAARGGDTTNLAWDYTFSGATLADGTTWSDDTQSNEKNTGLDAVGWYWYNIASGTTADTGLSYGAGYGTHQVGKKNANALGLFDMSGNVWEWCYDNWYDRITTGEVTNPALAGAATGAFRVLRGGSWLESAGNCSVCARSFKGPDKRDSKCGFRLVRSAE